MQLLRLGIPGLDASQVCAPLAAPRCAEYVQRCFWTTSSGSQDSSDKRNCPPKPTCEIHPGCYGIMNPICGCQCQLLTVAVQPSPNPPSPPFRNAARFFGCFFSAVPGRCRRQPLYQWNVWNDSRWLWKSLNSQTHRQAFMLTAIIIDRPTPLA